jgi:hypothetical protein
MSPLIHRLRIPVTVLGLTSVVLTTPVLAQQLYIYPQRGQTPEQQSRDRADCHVWAVQQTGFDPTVAAPPTAVAGAPQSSAVRGAAGGAAIGAVGGAIGGDAGKGAAIGAATGALFGGLRRRRQEQEVASAQANAQAVSSQQHAGYNRALAACLTGRGYTVQ